MTARVGEIAQQVRGVSYSKGEAASAPRDGHVPILRANNITEGGLTFDDVIYVPCHRVAERQYLKPGDLVIAASSGSIDVVGKAAEVRTDFHGAFGAFCKVLRPNERVVNSRYLAHFFRTPVYRKRISALAAGANINNLRNEHLDDLGIPLPPLDEQRRIAAILDKADALRRKRKRALDLLDVLTQSIFLEMFGDPVANPRKFPLRSFGEVGTLDRGVSKHRPRNEPRLLGGPHPLIQTGDVAQSGGYIRKHSYSYSDLGLKQSRKWPTGTLCITIAANIAETGILTFDACFPDSVVGFTHPDPAMVQYVRVWLSFLRSTLEKTAPSVAQKNINLKILRELPIAMPPASAITEFGSRLEAELKMQEEMSATSIVTEALFASLQSRAFSGQLYP